MTDINTISTGELIMDKANAFWCVKFVNRLAPLEPHIVAEMCRPEDLFGALRVTAVFTSEALKPFRKVESS